MPHGNITTDAMLAAGGSAAFAADLVALTRHGAGTLVFIDATGDRLDRLVASARQLAPELEVLGLPALDTLPYDRMAPAASTVAERVATLVAVAEAPDRQRLLITSARAVFGLVPSPSRLRDCVAHLSAGNTLDPDTLTTKLLGWGYSADEHVEEPGQFAIHGKVVDIYPGHRRMPARLALEDGRLVAIHSFDPHTQRSLEEHQTLSIRPVVEIEQTAMRIGPEATEGLTCVLAALPSARLVLATATTERWTELQDEAADAFAATTRAMRARSDGAEPYLPPPSRLFMTPARLTEMLAASVLLDGAGLGEGTRTAPHHRAVDLASAIETGLLAGRVIVAMGGDGKLAARLRTEFGRRALATREAAGWEDALAGPENVAALLPIRLEAGFTRSGLTVLATVAVQERTAAAALLVEEPPRIGDMVVHRDHGVCRLAGLSMAEDGERVALEFANSNELLIPIQELDRVWRYGGGGGPIGLDHLHGQAWHKRRQEIADEVAVTARAIKAEAATRVTKRAPVIEAGPLLARFAARFTYPLSPDQETAVEAVLADLRSGRPMDRLVCGDVGFGKTEVALRAAAAAAFAGHQVAVMAPTSVLARQHFEVFERRFARLGIRIASLLRGAGMKDAAATRAGLADGSISIVVGTQAVATPSLRFKNLALVIIDEEQRFGDADKVRLAAIRNPAGGVHSLVMTATPIPRTLQGAMVGLRQISVIATPPRRRQPIRTFVLPYDAVVMREVLMREQRRGGQSFVICPRIEDLGPTTERLASAVPELTIITAHGRLKPQALEQAVAEFAAGEHDVLVATNIIEAGVDIPRANTILITRPDRFGLSQLHQMRGRVGRGDRRGFAYLVTDAGAALPERTQRRLATLASHDRLGAGFGISLADMDARGAGDLFGPQQAGHVHALGTELYQQMLGAALASEDGLPNLPRSPELNLAIEFRIPDTLVPEPDLRLQLYRRVARMADPDAAAHFLEEFEDRFGSMPQSYATLPDYIAVRSWCLHHDVVRVDAGPQAVALTTVDPKRAGVLSSRLGKAKVKGNRIILPIAVTAPEKRLAALWQVLN